MPLIRPYVEAIEGFSFSQSEDAISIPRGSGRLCTDESLPIAVPLLQAVTEGLAAASAGLHSLRVFLLSVFILTCQGAFPGSTLPP
jgi:hypothetical protein